MTLRFWRRVRIVPGLRVNLSKSGASVSVGRRGAWLTTGPRGQRATVGLPGTGLFWTEKLPPVAAARGRGPLSVGLVLRYVLAWIVVGIFALISYVIIATHYH
jgi:hypothetical protein